MLTSGIIPISIILYEKDIEERKYEYQFNMIFVCFKQTEAEILISLTVHTL